MGHDQDNSNYFVLPGAYPDKNFSYAIWEKFFRFEAK